MRVKRPPFSLAIWFALVVAVLASGTAHGQQNSNTLTLGDIVVELKRVNTVTGGANANLLYGTFAPGDSKLFLVQQGSPSPSSLPGKVCYLDPGVVDAPVGTLIEFNTQLPGFLDTRHFEKGLLGVAFHPDFADAGQPGYRKFYTYSSELFPAHGELDFTHPETGLITNRINNLSVLREWTANSTTPTSAVPARVILRIADPQNQHNGGTIAFNPVDRYLYWALGDGGGNSSNSPDYDGSSNNTNLNHATDGHSNSTGPGAPHGNGQDRTNPLGAMLRINPLSAATAPDANAVPSANGQYQIPTNNPFTLPSNLNPLTSQPYPAWDSNWVDEIFAYGLRNPYRFCFDRGNDALDPNRGKLYLADAGYNSREEVNLIVRGGNYGWVIREGTRSMEGERGIPAYIAPVNAATGLPDVLLDPIAEYDDSLGQAIIGGFVYRGAKIPALVDKYVFGEWNSTAPGEDGVLFYFDLAEVKSPAAPFTIYRLGISPRGASLPVAALLGFGEGHDGEVYALFDNGEIYSIAAQVSPHVPLRISAASVSGNEIHFSFPTHNGWSYRVEFKTALTNGVWTELQTIPGSGVAEPVSDALSNRLERYYRVVAEEPGK
jgi:glucose/arabinose dehydrogenase